MRSISLGSLGEKITAFHPARPIFGGFEGGLYCIEDARPAKMHAHSEPISCIAELAAPEEHGAPALLPKALVIGDWTGHISQIPLLQAAPALDTPVRPAVRVSRYPIKYIYTISAELMIASDCKAVYLVGSSVLDRLHIGTYLIHVRHCSDNVLVLITGYSILYLKIEKLRLHKLFEANLQQGTEETESITAIRYCPRRNLYFCGTNGGWITVLEESTAGSDSAQEHVPFLRQRKLFRGASERITAVAGDPSSAHTLFFCTSTALYTAGFRTGQPALLHTVTEKNDLCSLHVQESVPGRCIVGTVLSFLVAIDTKSADTGAKGNSTGRKSKGSNQPATYENTLTTANISTEPLQRSEPALDEIYTELLGEIEGGLL